MRHLIHLVEQAEKLSVWEQLGEYGIDYDFKSKFHDASLGWINRNNPRPIDRFIKNPKARMLSKIILANKLFAEDENWSRPHFTVEELEQTFSRPVTMWRGGGGVYDPDYADERSWSSFTISQRRSVTFSEYDGTRAGRSYSLPKRSTWWVVELTIPLNDILLYLFPGMDEEVIISSALAKGAKLIKTHEGSVE